MYDMLTYTPMCCGDGAHPHGVSAITRINNLKASGVPQAQVALGIGMPTLQGHEIASCSNCGANCGPGSDKRIGKCCGCNLYNWTQPELHAFLLAAEGAHIREVFVARPLGVPPGMTNGTPKWFVDELAGFLQRDPLVQATHSQATHSLSTQY